MRINLLGSVGVIRYSNEIYLNVKRLAGPKALINQSMYSTMPFLGAGLAFPLKASFKNFKNYDIVHNLPGYPLFYFKNKDTSMVTTVHEFQSVLYPELNKIQEIGFKDKIWTNLVSILGIRSAIASDIIVVNSIQTKQEAISIGIPKEKVYLTELGVDSRFLKAPNNPKKGKKLFKIGFIGTLSPRKNVLFLISAFKKIPDKDIRLELWGKSIYPSKVITDAIGSDRRITWKGFAPESKFIDIYDSFDVFAYPSLYEGFGLPILEAKTRGLPVILYKNGKISPEVRQDCFRVKDEDDFIDKIIELKLKGYNEKMQSRAVKNASKFTWERTAMKTLEAYNSLV
jgi:glycosyltransferase involved in cell wall biosynthesis